jgi:hypothetical protein
MKKYQGRPCLFFAYILLQLLIPTYSFAQKKTSVSNRYYISYPRKIMVRAYLSQKFVPFRISSNNDTRLNYKTTSKLNLGVGATVNNFTLNMAYGFKFLNPERGRGKTSGLDLQFHLYPYRWAIDFLGTFVKGYYLDPLDNNGLHLTNYYLRPDLKRDVVGFSAFRLANPNRFSYRAAATQNEWQTRSAGSLLYGGELYYGQIKGNSPLVPSQVNNSFDQAGIDKINFISVGPGAGYAYTWVIDKNFFVTGSATLSLDLNISTEHKGISKRTVTSVVPGGVYKAAVGYNSATWSVSANLLGNAIYAGSASSTKEYALPTGNYRLTLAKKIGLKRR